MGALVEKFGGKIDGELIRARDWNGMLAAVEELVAPVQKAVSEKLPDLEKAVDKLDARVAALEGKVGGLVDGLRARFHTLKLTAQRGAFAIGERGELLAAVSGFDGGPLPAGTRPWVDFVTTWGALLPAPGSVARSSSGGRAVSVQVNEAGEARVLIQADHARSFVEAEHAEVAAAMSTRLELPGQQLSIAEAILQGPTPASATVKPAFRAVTEAYAGAEGRTMRRYLDAHYLHHPGRVSIEVGSVAPSTWTHQVATVMAFVKADSDPLSPDAATASGSIQVTFRDWVNPWIVGDFLEVKEVVPDIRGVIVDRIHTDIKTSVDGVIDHVRKRVDGAGVLGGQRQLHAAIAALEGIAVPNPPPFFADAVGALIGGFEAQRAAAYGQSVTPLADAVPTTARALASATARATGEAARVGDELTRTFQASLGDAARALRDQVKADQVTFRAELLREDGPIAGAQREARDVRGSLESVNRELQSKAGIQFVTDLVHGPR